MCQQDQAKQYLDEWIEENQLGITSAVLAAFSRIDGVSEAMTDIDAIGTNRVHQKISGLIAAAHSVLPQYIGEEFGREFPDVTTGLAASLKSVAEQIATEQRDEFIDMLIQRHGH